jgi:alkaline phosphatase D
VEFGATSITSPSDGSYFVAAGVDFDAAVRARNPHVKWLDGVHHGYLLLTLTREQATSEFFAVSTILSSNYELARVAAFTVAADAEPGVGAIVPA